MAKRAAKASSDTLTVDFSGVEERKGGKHFKPGDYAVKVVKATNQVTKEKKTPQISFELQFIDGPYKGSKCFHNCNLLPQSLWVLRNMLEAIGIEIPKKRVKLDLPKCTGKKLAVTIEDDEYDGKVRSRVVDTFPLSELVADEADEDEELDEDDDDEDEDDEDEDDEDLDEVDL
jgi:hypothetical protein